MNRNNIWIHIGLAAVMITLAAILGQLGRWQDKLHTAKLNEDKALSERRAKTVNVPASETTDPEVMVRFRPGVSLQQIRAIAAANNDRLEDEIESVNGLVAIDDLDDATPEAVAAQYDSLKDVVSYAEPNFKIQLDEPTRPGPVPQDLVHRPYYDPHMPNDPQFEEQWALNNLGKNGGKTGADLSALKAWAKVTGSRDVVVAVLDTGIDYTHKDLVANMWTRPDSVPEYSDDELGTFDDIHGFDADATIGDPMDDNGHGTHCAGIIGAEGDNDEGIAGINWKAQIMPLKFLGRGGFGTTKNAIEAINYAIDRKKHGVNLRVINASWGSTQYSRALEDAIRAAGNEGILFVAAAGNNSTDNDRRAHYPSNYNLPNVISVAALDRSDSLASFSNYGVKTVHLAAPGRDILSTWLGDEYREASGTSMAAPQVSGVAALILSNEPKLSVAKLRERLLASVDKIDSLNGKTATGGRLNAAKALGITQ
jgi:subtilisin family serine protease